jgi:hypothetical protein
MQEQAKEPSHPKPQWIERFGARLMQLQTHLNAVDAAKQALSSYAIFAHLEPEAAAEVISGQAPLGRPNAPEAPAEPETPLDGTADA